MPMPTDPSRRRSRGRIEEEEINLESDEEGAPILIRTRDGVFRRGSTEDIREPWDTPRNIPRQAASDQAEDDTIYNFTLKFLKLLTFLVTFFLVLGGAVMAKGSLLLMTSQLEPNRKIRYCFKHYGRDRIFKASISEVERISWMWVIIYAFSIPEIGTFLRCLRLGIFKGWKVPKKFIVFLISFICETLHVVGLGLLVFIVLPRFDVVKGIMLTNCICLIPAILGALSRKTEDKSNRKTAILYTCDFLFITFQISGLFWPLIFWDSDVEHYWALPVSCLLISFGWWENFVEKSSNFVSIKFFGELKWRLRQTRNFTYLVTSAWKIFMFLCMMMICTWIQGESVANLFADYGNSFRMHHMTVTEVRGSILESNVTTGAFKPETLIIDSHYGAVQWVFYIQIFAAYLCYVIAKFACRIQIQSFSFAFPLSLAVPTTMVILISFCGMRSDDTCMWNKTFPGYLFWTCPEGDFLTDFMAKEHTWMWIFWLASQIWITRHIWESSTKRLPNTEEVFITPLYSGLCIDQSIIMNRRKGLPDDPPVNANADSENSNYEEIYETAQPNDVKPEDKIPHVIGCATLWHEPKAEMVGLFKSIHRMDSRQSAQKIQREYHDGVYGKGHYDFEAHVFFDDAFAFMPPKGPNRKKIINSYVRDMMEAVELAACEVHGVVIQLDPPKRIPTPYGGRLEWTLVGKTKLIVHLKDKDKIRHKKRWSQVMYMYYLLGFRLLERRLSPSRLDAVADNTFLLALDGDIDFKPNAVELLLDLMIKNKRLGAACGRIHPIGSGPLVWYQKFEYAIGHWFQKATEHVIGCVLCSPGCFSLFRATALLADNVMAAYTKKSTEPRDFVQYDQGEDRWLCTLILQQGYRIEYSAASDAYTHAPTDFNGFFIQRRRWVPSTMANIFDLLMDYERTVQENPDISRFYIAYQFMLMFGSILGPGTIFLMLIGAFVAVFRGIDNWTSFIWNFIPIGLFFFVCFFFKSKTQLMVAQILSAIYALVMVAVLVALSLQMAEDGLQAPSSIFFLAVAASFIIAACVHPLEFGCLIHGIVYYITIPSMYMLLIIFSLFNLNDVSWGVRENAQEPTAVENVQVDRGFWGFLSNGPREDDSVLVRLFRILCCSAEREQLASITRELVEVRVRLDRREAGNGDNTENADQRSESSATSSVAGTNIPQTQMTDSNNNPTRTSEEERTSQSWEPWIDDRDLHKGPVDFLPEVEESFWKKLIKKYLEPHPPKDDPEEILRTRENVAKLRALRNSSVFAFFMLNAIFVLAIFLLQLNKDTIYINWPLDVKYNMSVNTAATEILVQKTHLQLEPIGLVFVVFFAIIIGVQFFAMLYHRMGTFTHLLAVTPLFSKSTSDEDELRQIEHLQRLNSVSPIVSSQDELGDPRTGRRRKTVHTLLTDLDRQPRVPTFSSQFVNRLQRSENINEASPSVLRRNRINPTIVNRLRRSTVLMEGQSVPANNRPYTSNLHQQGPRQNNAGNSWADNFVHQNTLTDDVFPNPGTFVRPQRVFEAGGSTSSEYGSRNPVIRGSRS